MQFISIAIGGAVGAILRFIVSGLAYDYLGSAFPWGTLVVNLIGCFLIGFLSQLFESMTVSPNTRMMILVGGLGAFTTFSTYSLENVNLLRDGQMWVALGNVAASTVLGVVCVFLGISLANYVLTH